MPGVHEQENNRPQNMAIIRPRTQDLISVWKDLRKASTYLRSVLKIISGIQRDWLTLFSDSKTLPSRIKDFNFLPYSTTMYSGNLLHLGEKQPSEEEIGLSQRGRFKSII